MKTKLNKLLLTVCVALSLASVSIGAQAYPYHCRWVNGYWHHGYYHKGYKICKGYRPYRPHCVWRNGIQYCR